MTSSLPVMTDINTVAAAIETSGSTITRRIAIYESDANTLWNDFSVDGSRLVSGGVSVDYDRDERRMLDISLENEDGDLNPDPFNGLWYDKIIKAYRGVQTRDWQYETQVGEFVIDRIDQDHFPGFVKITGRDYSKRMMKSKLEQATTFSAGTSLLQIISALAANSGVTRMNLDLLGQSLRADASFEAETERWKIAKDLCTPYNIELFVDRFGTLTARPFRDPVLSPSAYTLRTGINGNLVDYSKSINDSRIHNHVMVYGDNQELLGRGIIVFGQAKNEEPSSPTRISRLGTRSYAYKSSQFTENSQATEFAQTLLRVVALEEYSLNFTSLVYPWWEAGDILRFVDPDPNIGDPDRLLLTSFNIPMELGPTGGTGKRVTIVGQGSTPGSSTEDEMS